VTNLPGDTESLQLESLVFEEHDASGISNATYLTLGPIASSSDKGKIDADNVL
jgi:hypothetical protein